MITLGISAFYHDSAVAILRDDEIIFALQEERLFSQKSRRAFSAPCDKISYGLYQQDEFAHTHEREIPRPNCSIFALPASPAKACHTEFAAPLCLTNPKFMVFTP